MQIYIAKNNQRLGPYSLEEALRLRASGQISGTDLAWYEGIPQWIPLSQVPGMGVGAPPKIDFGAPLPPVVPAPPPTGSDSGLFLKRILTAIGVFFPTYIVLFIVIFFVAMVIGGAISGAEASATQHAQGFDQGYQVGAEAGRKFGEEWSKPILAIDAVVTLVLAAIIALAISFSNLLPWCRRR
jgi:hypothetical protein